MSYWISKSVAGRGAKGVVNPFKIISKIISKMDFVGDPTGASWDPINEGANQNKCLEQSEILARSVGHPSQILKKS